MRREISILPNNGYPYYLHNNEEFVNYWKTYFEEYPIQESNRFEIYIDFPFCRSICKFCVYGSNTYSNCKDIIPSYERAVIDQIHAMKNVFPNRLNDIYFGGGTPTLWSKDAIREIISNIPTYDIAGNRTIETHSYDLNDDWIRFIIDEMRIKTVSIGVQSFDLESCKGQKRIPTDISKLKRAVEMFHEAGVFVNVDLVALFNFEGEKGYEIFEKDLNIAASIIKPDDICSNPNFRTKGYYSKSIRYRQILKNFIQKYPQYSIEEEALSLNFNDIIAYAEEAYHLTTKECHDFFEQSRECVLGYDEETIKENCIIGFGGANGHNAISRVGMRFEDIFSYYDFYRKRLIHNVRKVTLVDEYSEGDEVPIIRIGNCNIDTTV